MLRTSPAPSCHPVPFGHGDQHDLAHDRVDRAHLRDDTRRQLRLDQGKTFGDRIRPNTESMVRLLQERVNLGVTFGLIEMPIFSAGNAIAGYLVQPRVLLKTEIITRTVFVANDSPGAAAISKVEQTEPLSSLSEQAFYASLAKIGPAFPASVRSLLGLLTDQGCETQLLRKHNVYLDDGLGLT